MRISVDRPHVGLRSRRTTTDAVDVALYEMAPQRLAGQQRRLEVDRGRPDFKSSQASSDRGFRRSTSKAKPTRADLDQSQADAAHGDAVSPSAWLVAEGGDPARGIDHEPRTPVLTVAGLYRPRPFAQSL